MVWAGKGVVALALTSGLSSLTELSNTSQRTSTGVLGLIAIPACIPWSWMNLINSFGLVRSLDFPDGESAAVDDIAAS